MNARLASKMKMAKLQAEALLKSEGLLTGGRVDPIAIATSRDIVVQAKPDTHDGVSGMLVKVGDTFGILYATYVPSTGFHRYSIAHELGHYFLAGHLDQVLKNGSHASYAGYVSGDPFELEADAFASGLLMPSGPMKKICRTRDAGIEVVERAAEIFETSLTATAIRYAEVTDDAVAVIVSTGPTIDYCFMSEAMKSLPKIEWPKKGMPVPISTATKAFNANVSRVAAGERDESEIDVRIWLGGSKRETVSEQIIGLGRYRKTLTVLASNSIGEGEVSDEEEEDRLLDSWTPKFR